MASHKIYEFYAELENFEPKIWRRFQVMDNITVARFGYIIQVLFEMTANHLMQFEVPKSDNFKIFMAKKYPDMDLSNIEYANSNIIWCYEFFHEDLLPEMNRHRNMRVGDATKTKIHEAVMYEGDNMQFNYDFGDNWWINLKLEKVFKDKDFSAKNYPRVLDGENLGIIEDVGGVRGLKDFVKAFQNKKGADYIHFSKWLGIEDFDISVFDIDDMNFRLKKLPRIYEQSYEKQLVPTQKSYDLIFRKYLNK